MAAKAPNLISSGIEPVDKLLGGLEPGQLYLVHGDASGKSLFGIKFLIEGLKRGENGALVIRYSPEDAVRRFARLGYDCLEDVYSGRLVILEYSNEIIQQIARLRALAPVLRELEWLLGETRPRRLVFDPVTHLVVGEQGDLESRVQEFAAWARSFGATVALVANCENDDVIRDFQPLVQESFRFEVKDVDDRATRFFVFEKTPLIPEQPIEVDPSRGVFLLTRAYSPTKSVTPAEGTSQPSRIDSATEVPSDSLAAKDRQSKQEIASGQPLPIAEESEPLAELWLSRDGVYVSSREPASNEPEAQPRSEPVDYAVANSDLENSRERPSASGLPTEGQGDLLSDLLDDLAGAPSEFDLTSQDSEFFELDVARQRGEMPFAAGDTVNPADQSQSRSGREGADEAHSEAPNTTSPGVSEPEISGKDSTGADARSDRRQASPRADRSSTLSARTVEILLRPPDAAGEMLEHIPDERRAQVPEPIAVAPVANMDPKEFNVLVIDDDTASCELISQALGEYTVETVHDGISGLAKLISFKPDLVILNVDLPIIDGFKILSHIRSSLNMPIIIISGSRVRASDRLLSTELGADYYLTKPFSVKELRHKAKQLIARHRGISSWIVNSGSTGRSKGPETPAKESHAERRGARAADLHPREDYFIPYADFVARVEKGVKAAIENGVSFSIVGCRVPDMTTGGGRVAISLLELVRALVRDTDVISTNPRNDIVVLLADAEAEGARAFAGRLRDRIAADLKQDPNVWVRSFPELEEKTGRTRDVSSDSANHPAPTTATGEPGSSPESGASYIDFLERKA
jgi:two-component system, OmpR family, alkaline phosphatase synthesis response regulator PhoP